MSGLKSDCGTELAAQLTSSTTTRGLELWRLVHAALPAGLFYLPEDGPAMWPMWRPPRPASLPHGDTDHPVL